MTEYTDKVERQRVLQEAEEWGKGIKYIHANNGVIETTGKITWQRTQATKDILINKFFRATSA